MPSEVKEDQTIAKKVNQWLYRTVCNRTFLCEFFYNNGSLDGNELLNQLMNVLKNCKLKEGSNHGFETLPLSCKDIGSLSGRKSLKHVFPQLWKIYDLVLVLPCTSVSNEQAFSAMKFIKSKLRSKMGEGFLDDELFIFIEKL